MALNRDLYRCGTNSSNEATTSQLIGDKLLPGRDMQKFQFNGECHGSIYTHN